ncbi:MAG TPA: glycosyltransferase family 9 protein [Candidatus Dormibacteraeota bacterium]|nr:glycosyltransferase family 9 protein [Candidatus Dormibacteraeota bacterium]
MPKVSPSVLIIRLDAIGDALALTPLLAALRGSDISADVVLRSANAGIFAAGAARRIVIADFVLRSSGRSNLASIDNLGHELRASEYSHVLVATEDPGGYRLAGAVGAPDRIGFADPWGKPLKALWSRRFLTRTIYRTAGLDPRAPHECEVMFRLGGAFAGEERPTRDLARLRPMLLEREPAPDDRVAVQITDKWQRLGIPLENVVELIRRIESGGTPRLLSAASEAPYAERIARATNLSVTYFDALEPWKAAIAAAPAIVTPDSGALHVAGMVGTPVVAVFPPARSYALQVARWAPWAAPHRIVRAGDGWPVRANDALAQLLALR